MIDVEYVLHKDYSFAHSTGKIYIGIDNPNLMRILNDSELNVYISDSLTHEFLHELLEVEFNLATCKLFDMIQQHFRTKPEILEKLLKNSGYETWDAKLKRLGTEEMLNILYVDNTAFNQAYMICNKRL